MCHIRNSLSERHYDYTTILSYVSLKSGCRTYLTTHVKDKHLGTYLQFQIIIKHKDEEKQDRFNPLRSVIPSGVAIFCRGDFLISSY